MLVRGFALLELFYFISNAAHGIRCLSCLSDTFSGVTCQNTASYLDCDDASYGACYTLTKTIVFPIFGSQTRVEKNCTLSKNCAFLLKLKCPEIHGLNVSCSVQCCSGDFCNTNFSFPIVQVGSDSSTVAAATVVMSSSSSWQPSVVTTATTTRHSTLQVPTVSTFSGSSFCGSRTDFLLVLASLAISSQVFRWMVTH